MTIETLKQILRDGGFCDARYYIGSTLKDSIIGGIDSAPSLLKTEDGYEVFESERGCRNCITHFSSEDEACAAFLRLVFRYGDYLRLYNLGATMSRDKADEVMKAMRRISAKVTFEVGGRGDGTSPWYFLSVDWKHRMQAKEIADTFNLEWKFN